MIEIIQRSKIETRAYELNYANNSDLEKAYENENRDLPEKNDQDIKYGVEEIGKFPIVWLDGVILKSENIDLLELRNDRFYPTLSIKFIDISNRLVDENYPLDNSVISIFKDSLNKDTMAIKMDFKVTSFEIIKGTSRDYLTLKMEAKLQLDDLYLMNFESFNGNSFDVLKTISTEMGLGYASNVYGSNDKMTWINPANYKIQFMKEIIEKSYISDDTFIFGYIDYYYNFNYVDIEKQLKSDISNQTNILNREGFIKDGKNDEVPLILTNNPDKDNTNMYIEKYTMLDNSTDINLTYGYKHIVRYYRNNGDGKINDYFIDAITDDSGNKIVMKGQQNEGNDSLYNNMTNGTWLGKIDNENAHENYLHCKSSNLYNLKFSQKLKMVIRLKNINFSLYRFQKVLVELYNMGKMENLDEEEKIASDNPQDRVRQHDSKIINKLSGEWLITAINIKYIKNKGSQQEITMIKRELTEKYDFPTRQKTNNNR